MSLRYTILSLVILASSSLCSFAGDIQSSINRFVNDSALRHGSVGISVVNLRTGETLGANAPMQSDITASTMKTVTSSTALNILGKDFTFHTRAITDGEIDNKGHLNGNLIIEGGGDPTLGSRHFPNMPSFVDAIISALQEKNIKQIKGDVIIDDSLYPYPPVSGFWMLEDIPCDYGTGLHALNFADNIFQVNLRVTDSGVVVDSTEPKVSYAMFYDHAKIIHSSDSSLSETGIMMMLDPDFDSFMLYGNVVPQDKVFKYTCANPNPTRLLRDSIMSQLERMDIKVKAKEIQAEELGKRTTILDYQSPKLSDILLSLLDRSDNMFTEGMLRALAVNAGKQGTAENGIKVVKDYWTSQGVDVSGLFMYDGSGLARNNKANAAFFTSMLCAAEKISAPTLSFASLMPRIGTKGRGLLTNTSASGRYALKSGSMSDVQCYVGYFPADEPKYAIALLINNYDCSRSRLSSMIESLLVDLMANLDQ